MAWSMPNIVPAASLGAALGLGLGSVEVEVFLGAISLTMGRGGRLLGRTGLLGPWAP